MMLRPNQLDVDRACQRDFLVGHLQRRLVGREVLQDVAHRDEAELLLLADGDHDGARNYYGGKRGLRGDGGEDDGDSDEERRESRGVFHRPIVQDAWEIGVG